MGIDVITLAKSKKYTDETVVGGGAIKGKNCTITSIQKVGLDNIITFQWTLDDGTIQTDSITVKDGENLEISKAVGNALSLKLDGLYVPEGAIKISKEAENAIEVKADGIYVKAVSEVAISEEEGNIIEQKDDGLYAKADEITVSKKTDNAISLETDGLYVPVDEKYNATSDNAQSGKAVAEAISASEHLSKSIITKAEAEAFKLDPTSAKFNTIYLVKDDSAKGNDKYFEYQRLGDETTSTFECTGDTSVDLTDYLKKADIDDALSDTSENPVQNKVIKGELDKKIENKSTILGDVAIEAENGTVSLDAKDAVNLTTSGEVNIESGSGEIFISSLNDHGIRFKALEFENVSFEDNNDNTITLQDLIDGGGSSTNPEFTGTVKIKKTDGTEVFTTDENGHLYTKGQTINGGTVVNGTFNVPNHDIRTKNVRTSSAVFAEGSVETCNTLKAVGSVQLAGGMDDYNCEIEFFHQKVTKTDDGNGDWHLTLKQPLAWMSKYTMYLADKGKVNYASLNMGEYGRLLANEIHVREIRSYGNGIDVETAVRFNTHITTGQIDVEGGYPIIIYDSSNVPSIHLSSTGGAIHCGDIHCDGYEKGGNSLHKHDVDGIYKLCATKFLRYIDGYDAREIGSYEHLGELHKTGDSIILPTDWTKFYKIAIVIGNLYDPSLNKITMRSLADCKEFKTQFLLGLYSTLSVSMLYDGANEAFFYFDANDRQFKMTSGDLTVYDAHVYGVY